MSGLRNYSVTEHLIWRFIPIAEVDQISIT